MSETPAEHLPIIADRFRTFDDPRMSRGRTEQRRFCQLAVRLVANEREARRGLKVSRRLITVEMVL